MNNISHMGRRFKCGMELIGVLMPGHNSRHFLQGGNFLLWLLGCPESLLSLEILWR